MLSQPILKILDTIQTSDPQEHANLVVLPLRHRGPAGPAYITLSEALAEDLLQVTEVDEGGSVNHLRVTNRADRPVLLLDGETLRGAKQNRVLNTTVLLAAGTETILPVSCVEHGRWSWRSRHFDDADTVMFSSGRARKMASVSFSLAERGVHASDQAEVWEEVARLERTVGVRSETGDMDAVYDGTRDTLESYLEASPLVEEQTGLLALVNGRPLSLELVSRPEAYRHLHQRLLRSVAMEALLRRRAERRHREGRNSWDPRETAAAFIRNLREGRDDPRPAVALGTDHRLSADGATGLALEHEGAVIHLAALADPDREKRRPAAPGEWRDLR